MHFIGGRHYIVLGTLKVDKIFFLIYVDKSTEDAYISDDDLDLLVAMADGKPVIFN